MAKEEVEKIWQTMTKCERKNASTIIPKNVGFISRCDPSSFHEIVKQLTIDQNKAVRSIGFGALVELKCRSISQRLCQQLVQLIDPLKSEIIVHGSTFLLSPTDFGEVMGVKDNGEDIVLEGPEKNFGEIWRRITDVLGGEVTKDSLHQYLISCGEADDTFKICFAMFSLATILCPTEGASIDCRYIKALRNTSEIWLGNWSSFCMNHLMEAVKRFADSGSYGYCGGSMLFLQLYYCRLIFEKLQFGPHDGLPIVSICDDDVIKLIQWIRNHGGLTCRVVFRGVNLVAAEMNKLTSEVPSRGLTSKENDLLETINIESDAETREAAQSLPSLIVLGSRIQPPLANLNSAQSLPSLIDLGNRLQPPLATLKSQVAGGSSMETDLNSPPEKQVAHTPLTANAKRNLFQIQSDPSESLNLRSRMKVHPFNNLAYMTESESKMFRFLFPKKGCVLTAQEAMITVAACGGCIVSRGMMRCLEADQELEDDIINIMATYLNNTAEGCWYLPTYFKTLASRADCAEKETVQKTRKFIRLGDFPHIRLLTTKIFIPIHDVKPSHWFLLMVDPVQRLCHLYDSFTDVAKDYGREVIARKMLLHLDRVLVDKIKECGQFFAYADFTVVRPSARFSPRQTRCNDCGVYVITHMENQGGPWMNGTVSSKLRIHIIKEVIYNQQNTELPAIEAMIHSAIESGTFVDETQHATPNCPRKVRDIKRKRS